MKKITPNTLSKRRYLYALTGIIPVMVLVFMLVFTNVNKARATIPNLNVNIIAAPNLIVDSNVLSPSTYQPIVATVIGEFCNNGGTDINNLVGYIGDVSAATPGIYPVEINPLRDGPAASTQYVGNYSFTHLGSTADATRSIGTLPAGECSYQYWSFTYPKLAEDAGGTIPAWGSSVKDDDDLWLTFDIWASNGDSAPFTQETHTMTMRNEISAMANKIKPNGANAGVWFNTDTSTVLPGDTIVTNGILYRLGNINQGFDNDNDGDPDYNAWVQPFGDPAYDPNCFRLISTSGTLTVTRSAGNPDMIINFEDQLYFTDMPADNTNVVGEVFYEFLAISGACTIPITPYQEVASGSDNEKFNGDYGTGIPPVASFAPAVTLSKTAPDSATAGTILTYAMEFTNQSTTTEAGLTLSSGGSVDAGVMISDTIPAGLEYQAGSASSNNTLSNNTVSIRYYSTVTGNWTTAEPATATDVGAIQWWLDEPLAISGSGDNVGTVRYQALIPGTYSGDAFIENCAEAGFGDSNPFAESCDTTMILGSNSIGDFVWQDDNNDGVQDVGEPGLADVTLSLYWDKNGDGEYDSDDVLIETTTTDNGSSLPLGEYLFDTLPNGNFIVIVDDADTDIPTGYRHTTPLEVAVTDLGGAVASPFVTADFGFGPSLAIYKTVVNNGGYEDQEVTYLINVVNLRPGGGNDIGGACEYTVWATEDATGGNATGRWNDAENAFNGAGPDNVHATSFYANSVDTILGTGFNTIVQSGSITKVEALYSIYHNGILAANDDTASGTLFYNGVEVTSGTNPSPYDFRDPTDVLVNYGEGVINQGLMAWDITDTRTWGWADFSLVDLGLDATKNAGGDGASLYLDSIGVRITADEPCRVEKPSDTFRFIPLTDTYDTSLLTFLSANPAETADTGPGTLSWDDVGPLSPGETRSVEVTFLGKTPPGSPPVPTTNINTACANNAKFANGQYANDDCDTVTSTITPTSSIAGTIWSDLATLGWQGIVGYEAGTDLFIADTTVNLYYCDELGTPVQTGNNRTCTDQGVGNQDGLWMLVDTQQTDASGDYQFDGLHNGYYYVEVDTVTIPTSPAISVDADADSHGTWGCTSSPCATDDSLWQEPGADLGDMFSLTYPDGTTNGSQGDITEINFGYALNPAIYGSIWHDVNGNGNIDTSDHGVGDGVNFIRVYLDDCGADPTCSSGVTTVSVFTDVHGKYEFTSLTAGNTYRIRVDTTTLPVTAPDVWVQTIDPGGSGSLDDTHLVATIAAGEISGSHDFGYTDSGTGEIGDTVFYDWNGDGIEQANEPGIIGVTVRLREDVNGDGIIDHSTDGVMDTQVTDSTGYYNFTNLPVANYIVEVDETTLPVTTSYVHRQTAEPTSPTTVGPCVNCNGTGQTNLATAGQIRDTVDFGYQPTCCIKLGDFVWQDDNGDGIQDAGESGLANIHVTLYANLDGDGDTSNDPLVREMDTADGTINPIGYYQFTYLPEGDYLVRVDTADADLPTDGTNNLYVLSTNNDPHVAALSVGDVYTTADFGFTAPGAIGDLIWQDNNGNGEYDTGEPGINGVRVNLYIDVDNSGDLNTPTDTLYGFELTADDSQGNPGYYRFSPLSADNYIVEIPSTGNTGSGEALEDYVLTADPDSYNDNAPTDLSCLTAGAMECDGVKAFDNQPGSSSSDVNPGLALGQIDLTADFGYQPAGIVGDYVWGDFNDDGVQDSGEPGFDLVDVFLCATSDPCLTSSGDIQATATTNADGYYYFTDVTVGTHIISVDTGDLPANWTTNTYDRDGNNNSSVPSIVVDTNGDVTSVNSVACTDCNLEMDFGYRSPSQMSGFIFFDADSGDGGAYNGGTDVPYPNIYVYLYDSNGDPVGYTTTDSAGQYFFDVPNGDYTIRYSTSAPALQGLPQTAQTSGGSNVTIDGAIEVTLSGTSAHNDFGFYASMDCGDLPEGNFHTSLSREGACHVIGDHYLGTVANGAPDAEANGQPDAQAGGYTSTGGDDNNGNLTSDEDGVNRVMDGSEQWTPGEIVHLNVDVVGVDAYLVGWLDWNNNGTFDAGEMIDFGSVTEGSTQSLAVTVPGSYVMGVDFMARFRLYDGKPASLSPSGQVDNGEVEDYYWEFADPTAVSMQNIVANNSNALALVLFMVVAMFAGTGMMILNRRRIRIER